MGSHIRDPMIQLKSSDFSKLLAVNSGSSFRFIDLVLNRNTFGQFFDEIKKRENLDSLATFALALFLTALTPVLALFGESIPPTVVVTWSRSARSRTAR